MKPYIPTPQIGHLTEKDYEEIYEPAEDSFILLDALEEDSEAIIASTPVIALEVGSGSGIVSTFLRSVLGTTPVVSISTDINPLACSATLKTGIANNVTLDAVNCDLVGPLSVRLGSRVDILLFNPPYVPTSQDELDSTQSARGIGGAWAGGNDGMEVTHLLLDQVPTLLSPSGRFYLVAIEQNKPADIIARMATRGLHGNTILRRRAGGELLSVLCFTHHTPQS